MTLEKLSGKCCRGTVVFFFLSIVSCVKAFLEFFGIYDIRVDPIQLMSCHVLNILSSSSIASFFFIS
jgi:hypothetical protein